MHVMKIASLQTNVYPEKARNLAQLEDLMNAPGLSNVDIVTLPEMFTCPYQTDNFPLYAESAKGETWSRLSALAREKKVYLSAGSIPEVDENGRVYNTAYVFDRQGHEIAKHRKAHLFDIEVSGGQCFKESDTLTPGDHYTVFETEFCKIGLCICYDFRFPELARCMVDQGAKVLLVPAAFNMTTGPAHWEILFRQRAVDNQVYTVGTAPARQAGGYVSWGHSIIVGPWGNVLMQMDEQEGVRITAIDLDEVDRVRQELPLLRHRRKDIYNA